MDDSGVSAGAAGSWGRIPRVPDGVRGPADGVGSHLRREIGFRDATLLTAGCMIGSGIFVVPADVARLTGAAGWILVTWGITAALTVAGAASYGRLAARMPLTGGPYAYLRELWSPLVGFLYGFSLFLVIQTGSLAAVAVGFAKFLGVLVPAVAADQWIVPPVAVSDGYALSLSTQQFAAILMIAGLTALNARGLAAGRRAQNLFTTVNAGTLLAIAGLGFTMGWDPDVVRRNFADAWTAAGTTAVDSKSALAPTMDAASGAAGLLVALGMAQVGALFAADGWNYVTIPAGEVKDPRRTLPRALACGAGGVVILYLLVNAAYLVTLPVAAIQSAPDDRVATAAWERMFGGTGAAVMAAAIAIATLGCNNGLILAGARAFYAMARDGLFFRAAGRLNRAGVPGAALWMQAAWACLLVIPRTRTTGADVGEARLGSLYGDLLDYVMVPILLFYILIVGGLFRRRAGPGTGSVFPALYGAALAAILALLLLYRPETAGPGFLIVLAGVPVYLAGRRRGPSAGTGACPPSTVPD